MKMVLNCLKNNLYESMIVVSIKTSCFSQNVYFVLLKQSYIKDTEKALAEFSLQAGLPDTLQKEYPVKILTYQKQLTFPYNWYLLNIGHDHTNL